MNQHQVRISAIKTYFPITRVTSEEAATSTGLSAEIRINKLGISSVSVAGALELSSDLAVGAIDALFTNKNLDKQCVDFLIVVTQSPDYQLPTTACIVQEKSGLPKSILAYDVNQGCSGYIIGLAQAVGLIASGICKQGILVTAEQYNKVISREDKDTYGLFGDGASATLLEKSPNENEGFRGFFFGTDGSGAQHLIVKNRGTACSLENLTVRDKFLYMNGRAIFEFVSRVIPKEILGFLKAQNVHISEVDHWMFHQANKYMNTRLCSLLSIPSEKAYFDIHDIGNTVSSSIPIAIARYVQSNESRDGKWFLCGFGVGLSWAGCLYQGKIS